MSSNRRYMFLCPIARALDTLGDRWELLILRDLHAGPARFKEIQAGLPGIATNMLSDRLVKLSEVGLIEKKQTRLGVTVYALTHKGARTRDLLLELALFGTLYPADDTRPSGSNRAVAVTLSAILAKTTTDEDRLHIQLNVGDEPYIVSVQGKKTDMKLGEANSPEAVLSTSYEALVAIGDGEITLEKFAAEEVKLVQGDAEALTRLLAMLGRSFRYLRSQGMNAIGTAD